MSEIPSYADDLFTDESIREPHGHYQALRDLGPVVWLEAHQMYALPRYAEARDALEDPATFVSGRGVGMNEVVNTIGVGSTLMSDGLAHDQQRAILARRLSPRALRPMRETIQQTADTLVRGLVERGSFDAVVDLAQAMPLAIVPDLVGWPTESRHQLLDWASAAFDILGPMNGRAQEAGPRVQAMMEFAGRTAGERRVLPDSAAAEMLGSVDRGELELARAVNLIVDYIAPSLDTTISAIGSSVWLLGSHPEQWARLRDERSLVANAFNEVIRLESPIRSFTRMAATETEIGGVRLPQESRVVVLFASANRDERQWGDDADVLDVSRPDAAAHLGFGFGLHGCAGQGLARLEGESVLRALLARVESLQVGEPVRALNNLIRALVTLPVTVHPAFVASAPPL